MTALRRANAAREEEGRGEQEACVATAMIERLYSGASEALSTYDSMESVGKDSQAETCEGESIGELDVEDPPAGSEGKTACYSGASFAGENMRIDFDAIFTYNGCTLAYSSLGSVQVLDEDLRKLL